MTIEELQTQLDQLKAQNYQLSQQNERLAFQLKRAAEEGRFGLHWLDVPEDFGPEADNGLPILKEVKDYALHSPDGKPTHVLIEGENYHALQCLSYTHAGKIDVIYIDPPYNTGSDGFRYRDKRLLTQYPDGTPVPKESPLRHSYWLSFMHKRLQLAHKLLSDSGVIFISIDDNEVAQLKLLCDEVFGEENFVSNLIWSAGKKNDSKHVSNSHEYIVAYFKKIEFIKSKRIVWRERKEGIDKIYKTVEKLLKQNRNNYDATTIDLKKWFSELADNDPSKAHSHYSVVDEKGVFFPDNISWPGGGGPKYEVLHPLTQKPVAVPSRGWIYSTIERMNEVINEGKVSFGVDEKSVPTLKSYLKDREYQVPYSVIYKDGRAATKRLRDIFGFLPFENPKDETVISKLIKLASQKNSTILDFFAGSGTTLHATMALNAEDGGQRQCILVTNNENNICEEVCYERNRRVMQGYTNAKGQAIAPLGNSLKYYRVGFVGKNHAQRANDEDLLTLAHNAGELLALAENTLYEIESTEAYQIFSNYPADFDPTQPIPTALSDTEPTLDFGDIPKAVALPPRSYTCIYFQEDLGAFEAFCGRITTLTQAVVVYIFSWSEGEFDEYFEHQLNVRVKSIPEPILKIYRSINQN